MNREEKRPELVTENEIPHILQVSKQHEQERIIVDMIQPIEKALETLRRVTLSRVLLPDTPTVMFRETTVQILLNSFFEELERVAKGRYAEVLGEAGFSVGESFGIDFMSFLRSQNKLPINRSILVKLWAPYDSSAGWGEFEVQEESEKSISIALHNNFLRRGLQGGQHKHCGFVAGYIEGFLWETFKEQYRWFKRSILAPMELPAEPVRVEEKPINGVCRFVVKLRKEEMIEAFDKFSEAKEAYRNLDYFKSIGLLRSALESGFKQKVSIDPDVQISFPALARGYNNKSKAFRNKKTYELVKDVYGRASSIIHAGRAPDKWKCEQMIHNMSRILRILELLPLKETTKQEISNSVLTHAQ